MNQSSLPRTRKNTLAIATLLILVGICALSIMAQSGRRVRKPTVVPPVATPEPSPTPVAKAPDKNRVPIVLGVDGRTSFANIPLYLYDSVLKSCAERLSGRSSIRVEMSSRDMNRGDAIKRAKTQTEGYVVLLELRPDSMRSDSRNEDLSRVFLEYSVFSATAGRQISSGRTYQQASGYKDVVLGRGRGNSSVVEYRLKEAAREAAERILAVLK